MYTFPHIYGLINIKKSSKIKNQFIFQNLYINLFYLFKYFIIFNYKFILSIINFKFFLLIIIVYI